MKCRTAIKILSNCGTSKSLSYSKQQVRKAVKISLRDIDRDYRTQIYLDFLSGGCYDTYRWRYCEYWGEPTVDFKTAHRIGKYLV